MLRLRKCNLVGSIEGVDIRILIIIYYHSEARPLVGQAWEITSRRLIKCGIQVSTVHVGLYIYIQGEILERKRDSVMP